MTSRRGFFTRGAVMAAAAGSIPTPAVAQFAAQQASIAVVCPLSGDQKNLGAQFASGVRQACDDANGVRGLLDHFWTMRTFDDQGAMGQALLQSRFAIDDQGQSLVIGHLGAKITDQVARNYSEAAMPQIVPATTYEPITGHGYRTIFRLPTKDSVEGILHAVFVKRENRGKRIVVAYQDGDYGFDVANGFLQQTHADGLSSTDVKFSHDKPDFPATARLILAQDPDLVFLAGIARDMGQLMPALRTAGFKGSFDASAGFFDAGLGPSFGGAVEGLVISTSMPPLQIVPAAYAVKATYEQHYGAMGPIAAYTYAATQIYIAAVRRISSTGRQFIARAIAQPIAFDTLVGSFTFNPLGDANDPNLYFYSFNGGQWRYQRAAHPSAYIVR